MADGVPQRIADISDLARIVHEFGDARRLLFRGQNVDEPLLPRIARIAQQKSISRTDLEQVERRMLERFRKECVPFLPGRTPITSWEWLSIAQHQGLPTRLLDWTASALAGVWFAVASDPKPDGGHGVLWVMNVPEQYERSPSDADDAFAFKETFVFQPFHLDKRIVSQSGWFTAHKFSDQYGKFLPLTKIGHFKNNIRKCIIPAERYDPLRRELRLMGVTQAAMFPDLSGLCADIQADCIDSWRSLRSI
ncbi:MAG: FRG domain-containing protein [Acidobacteria bacterium]|nr:FRG domain-containing protein [Acidobacteriota bacterium]